MSCASSDSSVVEVISKPIHNETKNNVNEEEERESNVELDNLFGALDAPSSDDDDDDDDVVLTSAVTTKDKVVSLIVAIDTNSSSSISKTDASPGQLKNDENDVVVIEDQEKKMEEEKMISTGTSHDKSIRSYSAMPQKYASTTDDDVVDVEKKPAKVYPFVLDPFQEKAVGFVEKGESVLVAAHTSAGKTVVAEYAIAKSLRDGQRVIYTSPIKALSNQKFRDLQSEFGEMEVGLMTGDITLNPTAKCLVMTTEILRSMLYRGSEVMREVAWVIYDEVHYMRDAERGVVWEESIILLPHKVRFVFLSATIPNAEQFVKWIAKIHTQPCHVVYTNYRPTPLQHYIFPGSGDGLHLVVNEKGKFMESNFQRAMSSLQGENGQEGSSSNNDKSSSGNKRKRGPSSGGGGGGGNQQNSDLNKIVKLIMQRQLHPVIIFSFSKKDCEKYAIKLNTEDFNTDPVEKDLITQVYNNALESLSAEDRTLPQVEALLPLLKKGIGIHHGGLLPILKEIVEILFSEGLVKCLFATETFAIGINMPAKTVVFTNTRKWDGKDFRWLTSGEYIQMSGRAGRRGKDTRGIVIQMMDEKMEPSVCKGILYGDPDPLNSSYKISYNMLLNMMRVEDVDPEYLLRASFHQFQQECKTPALLARAQDLETTASSSSAILGDDILPQVQDYHGLNQQLSSTQRLLKQFIQQPQYMTPYLQQPGRMIKCTINEKDNYGWGVLLSYQRKTNSNGSGSAGMAGKLASQSKIQQPEYVLDVVLPCISRSSDKNEKQEDLGLLWKGTTGLCRPVKADDDKSKISHRIFTISLDSIDNLSAIRLFIPKAGEVRTETGRKQIRNSMQQVFARFPDGVPVLDPVNDMKVKSAEYSKLLERQSTLQERLSSHPLIQQVEEQDLNQNAFTSSKEETTTSKNKITIKRYITEYGKNIELLDEAKALRKEAQSSQGMVMRDELKKMKRVLRHLGHVDAHGVIQTKGRTACEINTANELVVVELMFSGIFNDLSVEQCVALLSCLTFEDKRNEDDAAIKSSLKNYLSNPFYKLQQAARVVAKAIIACKIELDEDEFVEKFNPEMMEAVFAWCKGAKFVDVQKLTGTFEGTTIRTLRRLEELVRQLASASKAIGNHELLEKFEKGSALLKRDIVFCSSLYL